MTKVTIINFNDATRVFYDTNNQHKSVEVGGILDCDLSDTNIRRLRRDEGLVIMPPDVADKNRSGLMAHLLNTLRDWGKLSTDDKQTATEQILGVNVLGLRPSNIEMRMALAKRAKEAAYYIQKGADDTADELLGKSLPSPAEQRRLLEEAKGPKRDDAFVKGDEPDGDDEGSGNEALDRQSLGTLVPATDGPGVTPASKDGGSDRVMSPRPKPQRQVRRRPAPVVRQTRTQPRGATGNRPKGR